MIQVICAWHPLYFPNESPPKWGKNGVADGVSHGICEQCAKMIEELRLFDAKA